MTPYQQHLTHQLNHLSRLAATFYALTPGQMTETHEPTGLPNWHMFVLVIEAIGFTVHELSETQEVEA